MQIGGRRKRIGRLRKAEDEQSKSDGIDQVIGRKLQEAHTQKRQGQNEIKI